MKKDKREEAVSAALQTNYGKYYRLAYGYVHNEADALDIVQEAAYKAILKSDTLKEPAYADTWIYRIVINEAISFLRKRKDTKELEEADAEYTDAEHMPSCDYIDLHQAIDALPPGEKSIVILRFFEDRQLDEIAELLGENLSTVKSRLYRLMKKLRVSLE